MKKAYLFVSVGYLLIGIGILILFSRLRTLESTQQDLNEKYQKVSKALEAQRQINLQVVKVFLTIDKELKKLKEQVEELIEAIKTRSDNK